MQVTNIVSSNISNIQKCSNKFSLPWFSSSSKDSFTSNRLPLSQAENEIKNIKNSQGKNVYNNEDIDSFKEYYKQGKLDVDTVKIFADTKLKMYDIANVQALCTKQSTEDKKTFFNAVANEVKKVENANHEVKIEKSLFNPKHEIIIKDVSAEKNTTLDMSGEKVSETTISLKSNKNGDRFKKYTTFDYKNNSVNEKYQIASNSAPSPAFITYKEIIDYKNPDGSTKYKRKTVKSKDVESAYNIQEIYPDGKVVDIVKSTKDLKTGIVSIKKNYTSPDGTKSSYLYEDDPYGNRIIDYKIIDKKGNILFNNSQTFEVIDDNKFITSNDSNKYEISINPKDISIKDLGRGVEEKIIFKKIAKNNRNEVIKILKNIPGNLLIDVARDVKKVEALPDDQALKAAASFHLKAIRSSEDTFSFLHELGHIKDSIGGDVDEFDTDNETFQYTGNKKIQDVYSNELSNFLEKYPDAQRKEIFYFIDNDNHSAGVKGALTEVVAETNAIGNSIPNKFVEKISLRGEYLQENFPKTIAAIKNEMKVERCDFSNPILQNIKTFINNFIFK